ncbi:MAG: rhodanese-like domain-containing protein [Flavobacteriaceae bacterium]|nr:rhodanese-like domain-containing protein [Flavobacteriaceae bacterium]
MNRSLIHMVFLLSPLLLTGQNTIDEALSRYNSGSVPYVDQQTAYAWQSDNSAVFLDSRSRDEFEVSHLKNAHFVGDEEFNPEVLEQINLDPSSKIVVYCSIGVRSERVGEKLKKLGYQNIYNLYGGLFQWYNSGKSLVDAQEKITQAIHGYDKHWAKFINRGTPEF